MRRGHRMRFDEQYRALLRLPGERDETLMWDLPGDEPIFWIGVRVCVCDDSVCVCVSRQVTHRMVSSAWSALRERLALDAETPCAKANAASECDRRATQCWASPSASKGCAASETPAPL